MRYNGNGQVISVSCPNKTLRSNTMNQDKLYPIKNYEELYAITKTGNVWSSGLKENARNNKFNKDEIRKIFIDYFNGKAKVEIFKQYKIAVGSFYKVLNGESYRWAFNGLKPEEYLKHD